MKKTIVRKDGIIIEIRVEDEPENIKLLREIKELLTKIDSNTKVSRT